MKDALNREIEIDDVIFYGTTSRYAEFAVLKVVRQTAKTIFASKIVSNRDQSYSFLRGEVKITHGDHCVIINNEINTVEQNES